MERTETVWDGDKGWFLGYKMMSRENKEPGRKEKAGWRAKQKEGMWGQALKDLLKLWSYMANLCPVPLKQCHEQFVFLPVYSSNKVWTLGFQQNWFGFCPFWEKVSSCSQTYQAHTVHRVKECFDLVAALSQHTEQENFYDGHKTSQAW